MIRSLISFLCCILICSCTAQLNTSHGLPDRHPSELVGTWKAEGSKKDGLWFKKQYPNGKKVVVGLYHDTIFAYEAEWWVEDGLIYERITNSLYNDIYTSKIGETDKDQILKQNLKMHVIKNDSDTEPTVYIRTSGESFINKYQKIDFHMIDMQAGLPDYDDEDWVWLSAFRDKDTITYIYRKNSLSFPKLNAKDQKDYLIETIRKNSDLLADEMKFKIIYLLSDEKMTVINISPVEYAIE